MKKALLILFIIFIFFQILQIIQITRIINKTITFSYQQSNSIPTLPFYRLREIKNEYLGVVLSNFNDVFNNFRTIVKIKNFLLSFDKIIENPYFGNQGIYIASEKIEKKSIINQLKTAPQYLSSFFKHSVFNFQSFLISAKSNYLESARPYLSQNHFDLVAGMIFGDISTMSKDFKHNLKVIGMLHVVSASGYNVSLLLGLMGFFKSFLSRTSWVVFALSGVAIYAFLAGLQPSIIRASIMTALNLCCTFLCRRQRRPMRFLILTVLIMLCFNFDFINSISFQLSVLATLGIIFLFSRGSSEKNNSLAIMYGEVLNLERDVVRGRRKFDVFSIFKESLVITIGAQLFVWPVLLYHFGEINILSLVANTFLLWMTPLITIFGLLFTFLASLFCGGWLGSGRILLEIISFLIWEMITMFELSAKLLSAFEWMNINTNYQPNWLQIFCYWLSVYMLKKTWLLFKQK